MDPNDEQEPLKTGGGKSLDDKAVAGAGKDKLPHENRAPDVMPRNDVADEEGKFAKGIGPDSDDDFRPTAAEKNPDEPV